MYKKRMSKSERWKICYKPFEKYRVSTYGNIQNIKTGRILKPEIDGAGYTRYGLYDSEINLVRIFAHILVFKNFKPSKFCNKKYIDHIDRDPRNNNLINLRCVTARYNTKNRKAFNKNAQRIKVGQYNIKGKLIRYYSSLREASKKAGLSLTRIAACCCGKDDRGPYKNHFGGFVWKSFKAPRLKNEIWKPINGTDASISNMGRVKMKHGRITYGSETPHGYMRCGIAGKHVLIHRLVATAFCYLSNRVLKYVDHIDRNKQNNKASNLRWVTASQNSLNRKNYKKKG